MCSGWGADDRVSEFATSPGIRSRAALEAASAGAIDGGDRSDDGRPHALADGRATCGAREERPSLRPTQCPSIRRRSLSAVRASLAPSLREGAPSLA